jgi:hypothetical protein
VNCLPSRQILQGALLLALVSTGLVCAADDVKSRVQTIKAVGRQGAGNAAAANASRALSRLGADALPGIIAGFDDDNPIATNWLRAAADSVGERALKEKKALPVSRLEEFLLDTNNSAAGRRVAYEWLVRADSTTPERLLPRFLHDRSQELRRDAVARHLLVADTALARGDKPAAVAALREAFSGACDRDQVDDITKKLKEQGVSVDLAAHFGFICSWHLVAPFDNTGGKSFAVVYPPEKAVDVNATYKGKGGAECRWASFTTHDPYGEVNLNKALGKQKGTIAYARAVVTSPQERRAEFRIGCINALKVFHNGKELFGCEECHHGTDFDQYIIPVTLNSGRNEFLLKVCQNEQAEPWAQNWAFQARLCDAAGAAIPVDLETKSTGVK